MLTIASFADWQLTTGNRKNDHLNYADSHICLFLSDYRCAAAKRKERGYRRRIRRNGQPDGFRSTRRGHGALQSHDMVRHHLHGDFDHFVGVRIAPLRTEISVARRAKLPDEVAAGEPAAAASKPGAATAKIVVVASRWEQQPKVENS